MRKVILFILTLTSTYCFSQQEPQFTNFWNNFSLFNPGYTGANYKHYGALSGRNQWKIHKTLTGNYEAKLDAIGGGIGVGYMHDQAGLMKDNRVYLNYAFQIQLGTTGLLSFGASGVYKHLAIDYSRLIFSNGQNPFSGQLESQGKFDANFGAYFKRNAFEIGVSSTQIMETQFDQLYFQNSRHYYVMAAYRFKLSESVDLKTSVLFKDVVWTSQIDVNALFIVKKMYWTGITVRRMDAIAILAGIDISEKYRIGYSYDLSINGLFPLGSHELVVGIMIK